MSTVPIPSYSAFLFPILEVLDQSTGSLRKREMDAAVIERLGLTDEQLAVSYPEGSKARGSKILHRIAFARSSLKLFSAIDNSERSVWSIAPSGRALLQQGEEAVRKADSEMRKQLTRQRNERNTPGTTAVVEPIEPDEDEQPIAITAATDEDSTTWQQDLLSHLLAMSPRAFERSAPRSSVKRDARRSR